jgi:hypothetical protein
MFENNQPTNKPGDRVGDRAGDRVIVAGHDPIEFIYLGRRFHVHAVNSRWSESGGWWNRISDGTTHDSNLVNNLINDFGRSIWQVEAALIGAVSTFEIELDELTKIWRVRPSSRPAANSKDY